MDVDIVIKMVVSDFDYTMVNYRNGISNYQIDVLRRLKNKGILFSIVTGRNVSFFKQFPELLEVVDYIISSNGGAIYDVKNGKFLYNKCINDECLKQLIDYGVENEFTFIINDKDKMYKYGNLKKISSIDFDYSKQYFCEQIVFYVKNNKFDKCLETIKDINDVSINNISEKECRYTIDINHKDVSKGNSVLWLCNYLDILSSEVIGFGDGDNDISMFKVIGRRVCVENASDNLKQYADNITLSYHEDGVFKYIEDNILK